jgi:N utilization substance protein A
MTNTIGHTIEALCNEHGLDRALVIEAMKEAVKAAARRQFKIAEGIDVEWNESEGVVEISEKKIVVEEVENPATEISKEEALELTGDEEVDLGDILEIPRTEPLGRIAAQTAKQILIQKIREAVREKVFDEYVDRKGDLINGVVKRFERGDLIIDLGGNLEACLPKNHQVRSEHWNQGERVRVVIDDVDKERKGHLIQVSRTSPELLKRLFEMEVPEIYDQTVIIKSAVREPGERAKIAVVSNERDVDPVGACVGMKGSRVQSIIKELRGEKIDIIEWSDEPSVFAANALSPAKVSQVRITNIENRKMEVIVGEDQLSLAIGKRGQNVRLATRLVGWDIDIISEEKIKQAITEQMGRLMAEGQPVPVTALEGVTATQADILREKGISDIQGLASSTIDDLVDALDVSLDEAQKILSMAQAIVNSGTEKGEGEATSEEALQEVGSGESPEPQSAQEETTHVEAESAESAETPIAEEEAVQAEVEVVEAIDGEEVTEQREEKE